MMLINLLRASCAVAAGLTLVLMWTVTDFAHSAEDIAVAFYALLAIAPYGLPLLQADLTCKTTALSGLYLFGTVVIATVGLYAYYQAFFSHPNDHSGFLFLFVPVLQGLSFLGLAWALRKT
jgi:hypothetical protein